MLDKNEFVGTIPSTINKLSRLETFDLGDNYLTGTLPLELGELNRLEKLFLKDNAVHGSFFDKFSGSWPNLSQLVLDGTELTGTIPSTIGQWKLDKLSLEFVKFSGPFPALLSGNELTYLSVAGQHISATFPDLTRSTKLGEWILSVLSLCSISSLQLLTWSFCRDNRAL